MLMSLWVGRSHVDHTTEQDGFIARLRDTVVGVTV